MSLPTERTGIPRGRLILWRLAAGAPHSSAADAVGGGAVR